MERITLTIRQEDVYGEVAKATDYTGSKLIGVEDGKGIRNRILAGDEDLKELGRFWDEASSACNETLKEMLVSGVTSGAGADRAYSAILEVSKSFDQALTPSVESSVRSYFIASIIGQWFKFANKGEAADYFAQAAEHLLAAERLLYSRKRPTRPED